MLIEVLIFCHENFSAWFRPVKKEDNVDSHYEADNRWDIFFTLEIGFLYEIIKVSSLASHF
jgi:hypothetical protein